MKMGIVERLRSDAEDHVEVANSCDCNPQDTVNWRHAETAHEAANEIEQLRARVAELESRASPASVPEGWKLVPIEATMEMCEAGWNEYDLQEHFSVRFMYERMISVAPTPPVSEDRRDAERYRWLREQHWSESKLCVVLEPRISVRLGSSCPSLTLLDQAIDQSMQEDKP